MKHYPVMSTDYFSEQFEKRVAISREQLNSTKAKEYAKDGDRMYNFNQAYIDGRRFITREDAMMGFAIKHWVSVNDILDGVASGKFYTEAQIREKFGDMINYLILMEISLMQTAVQG